MNVLLAPLQEMAEFEEARRILDQPGEQIHLSGCVDSQKLHMIYGISNGFQYKIIATFSDIRVKEIYEDYKIYDKDVIMFPAKDLIFYQADIHSNQLVKERMKCFRRLMEGNDVTIITTFDALMTPQVPLHTLMENRIIIHQKSEINEDRLAKQLVAMGYEKNYQVEAPGQFSIRGGIIDIFDLTEENPYRMELWGDTVDSLRSFDVTSQRSIENKKEICIYPATEIILSEDMVREGLYKIEKEAVKVEQALRAQMKTEEAHRIKNQWSELYEQVTAFKSYANLESYIKYFYEDTTSFLSFFTTKESCFFLDEPSRIAEHARAIELEFKESMMSRLEKGYVLPGQADILYSLQEIVTRLMKTDLVSLSTLEFKNNLLKCQHNFSITAKSMPSYQNSFEGLMKDLKRYKKEGYRILLLSGSRTRAARISKDIEEQGLPCFYGEDVNRELVPGEIMTLYGRVGRGFEYPLIKFAVITESDIFGTVIKKKKSKKRYQGQKIQDFADLKVGDYVVHESHGLGVYKGIEKVEIDKVAKDYMKIQYRDGGNLYILATGLDVIQKYASADAKKPKLNKLGSKEWGKTKEKVKGAVGEVAKDLVELYALRQEQSGFSYGEDTVWQTEFEELFPYDETEDQILAIEATKSDMESKKIMDRLICGDVGYGKTEIAIRAAFKAVQEGKQVAYLVPTTILAQQHYNTFVQRMKDFPVRVDMLSRFRSSKEQGKTLAELKSGMVDIVIGTHRLLSTDVAFKDLGLLIVDEEQRFGVTHKEKIKKLKNDVDVLTLSATPIPRTLHMSLIGIRDMSVLEEAPNERLPIQTYVMEYNEEMVREAIVRELSRNGQVYYVYNRVNTIADVAAGIQALVPESNVAFAHGQMNERELEKIMYEFINGEIDVLVSTTIIETGLDISNVNTMIIHDSDKMGLSQLYQLRGRVGRSNRTSYAFLMYKRDKMLKEVAEKRLQAIKEFTDLGSGFKIAMRDLEIRGAGNLLGAKQHGHMEAVGYDLYCKMLNEAVKKQKGMDISQDFTTTIDLDVDAYIPVEYILNEMQKLDIYKRIAGIENETECNDMKEELMDRFGEIPRSVDNLLRIALIRISAHKLYINEVQGKQKILKITMRHDAKIEGSNIEAFMKKYGKKMKFFAKGTPFFTCSYEKSGIPEKDGANLLNLTEQVLESMKMLIL